MIGIKFDKAIRPLVLIIPKVSGCVETFQGEDKSNKSFCIDALPVYDDRYIKTKVRSYGDKCYANFRGLNIPVDDIDCESFTVISIDSLFVYDEKYYL